MESNVSGTDQNEGCFKVQELPYDVITNHILTRLPIKSVLRFKSVSKQWYSTLSSNQFGDAHFKLSSLINPSTTNHFLIIQSYRSFYLFTYNEGGELVRLLEHDIREIANIGSVVMRGVIVVLIGSCNGLVCVGSLYDFILWNPVTRQSTKVDSDPDNRLNPSAKCRVSWGFGYVASIDDYKVVRIIELPLTLEIVVHVFSIKSNSWRKIDPREYDHVISLRSFHEPVVVYGQCYMFHTTRGVACDERVNWIVSNAEVRGRRVVSFDLVNETFETCDDVKLVSREVYSDRFLCVKRGCLSTYAIDMLGDAHVSMYERTREGYQGKESILLSRVLSLDSCTDLIDLSSDGKFLVLKDDAEIGVVDSSLKPMTYKQVMSSEELYTMFFTRHVPSLVAPLIEKDSRAEMSSF